METEPSVVPRIRLFGKRVLVEPDRQAGHVSGAGLLLVEKWHPPATGTLISVGERLKKEGTALVAGQRVAFKPYNGTEIPWHGAMLRMLDVDDLLGIIAPDGNLEALT